MEEFWKEADVRAKHSTKTVFGNWRHTSSVIKKPSLRFRHMGYRQQQYIKQERRELKEKLGVSVQEQRPPQQLTDDKQRYELEEILSATNNFSDENLITEGASGKVYKGQLSWHGNVMSFTVRRLDCTYGQGDELQMEISTLKSLKHKNIISVLGHYGTSDEKIIIYEQASNGTLDQHLSDPTLTWTQRLHICLGVARALNHIHYDIIHCDINSSKIILDQDWEPKIYGFELSAEYPQSWMHRVRFSRYLDTNNLTPKYDVYCFGVLMFEVLLGGNQ